jgi:diguanylate cyclase (GGDEF)-like protein
LRGEDHLYRWGGEEFAIVTLHRDVEGTRAFAQRLFDHFSQASLSRQLDLPWLLTMSMATVELSPDLEEVPIDNRVFAAADQLLYKAKEAGRNQAWSGSMNEKGHLREDTIRRIRP